MGRLTPSAKQTLAATMARLNKNRRPPSVMRGGLSRNYNAPPAYVGERRRQYVRLSGLLRRSFWPGRRLRPCRRTAVATRPAGTSRGGRRSHRRIRPGRTAAEWSAIRKTLDAFANTRVVQHVDVLVVDEHVRGFCHVAGEPALRERLRAFHEQHDVIAGNRLANPVVYGLLAHACFLSQGTTRRQRLAGCSGGSTLRMWVSPLQSQLLGAAVVRAKACSTPPMRPSRAS